MLASMQFDRTSAITTDNITPAIARLGRYGNHRQKAKALYYIGTAYFNEKDISNAMMAYTEALSLDEEGDPYFSAMLHYGISAVYHLSHDNEEALKNAKLAHQYYSDSDKTEEEDLLLFNIAQCAADNYDRDEADSLFSVLLCRKDSLRGVSKNRLQCAYAFMNVCCPPEDYNKACTLYAAAMQETDSLERGKDYGAYAYALAETGDMASAYSLLNTIRDKAPMDYFYWRSLVEENEGKFKEATLNYNKSLDYMDSVIVSTLRQSPTKIQRNYFEEQAEKFAIIIDKLQLLIFLSVLGGCVLIAVVIFAFKRKAAMANKEKEELISYNDILTKQLNSVSLKANETSLQAQELQAEFVKIYKQQFEDFVAISNAVLSAETKKTPETRHREVYESAKELIKGIGSDEDSQKAFEATINRKMSGLMSMFREDFPNLNDIDYRFASYVFAQFDTTLMTMLFKYPSSQAIYNRKYRLREMIKVSNCKNKQLYLDMIG